MDEGRPDAGELSPSVERLYRHLLEQIEKGRLRIGRPLPKALFLLREFRLSPYSVAKAIARLVEEGYVHKRGKSFVVGRPAPAAGPGRRPKILFLVEREIGSWYRLDNPRTAPFIHQFEQESQHFNVRVAPLPLEGRPGYHGLWDAGRFPALARSLGEDYLGALVIGSRSEAPGLDRLLDSLGRNSPRVVWFDRYGEGWERPKRKNIFRHFFSEENGLLLALESLRDAGHRHAAYPGILDEPWIGDRLVRLQAAGRRLSPPVEVLPFKSCDHYWEDIAASGPEQRRAWAKRVQAWAQREPSLFDPEAVRAALRWLEGPRGGKRLGEVVGFRSLLILLAPQMLHILAGSPCTALLAPNDWHGRKYQAWLHYMQVRTPEDFSLLSFDNYRAHYGHPLSSIDFGMGYLGYASFHALLGDLHFRSRPDQSLPSSPRLVDRGSLGPAPPMPGRFLAAAGIGRDFLSGKDIKISN